MQNCKFFDPIIFKNLPQIKIKKLLIQIKFIFGHFSGLFALL